MRTTVKVCTARDEAEYSVMPASVAGGASFFLNIERVIQRKRGRNQTQIKAATSIPNADASEKVEIC